MVSHVLLDADGVVQRVSGGWRGAMTRLAGDRASDFRALFDGIEPPFLVGGDFRPALRGPLAEEFPELDLDEVYDALWLSIEVVPDSVALVRSLRAAGHGVHLGTNQHASRASYMKEELGYDDLFDTCFYSCDLGLAKPDVAYFHQVAASLGVAPGEVLFVDDSGDNVRGAQAAGMAAVQWTIDEGPERIRSLLVEHGATLES